MVAWTRRLTTTIQAEKNVHATAEVWAIVRTTHGLQTRAGATDEVQRQKSPTTPPRQAIHGDIVRRDTSTYGVLVGRETIALTPVEGHFTTTPTKKRNPHKNGLNSGRYEGRGPTKQ